METKTSFAEGAEAFTSYDKSKRNPYHKSDMNAYDWNLGYSAAKKAYKEGIAAHYDGKRGMLIRIHIITRANMHGLEVTGQLLLKNNLPVKMI
ncbi:MAG: hypothetical protein LRY51_15725 [Geovibrio sp.]|nr:hypothetical protein [Geovibrio sp.]